MAKMQTLPLGVLMATPSWLAFILPKDTFLGLQVFSCLLRKSWDGFAKKSHTPAFVYTYFWEL